jgi:ribose transport system substrate-binding protein
MRAKKIFATVLVFGLFLSSVAFSQSLSAVKGHKIGFIQLTLGTTYHAAMSDRFVKIGKETGANVSMVVSQNRSADEQLSLAEDLLSKGVEVLVLNPIGDEIVPSVLKLCQARHVPLICVDNTSPGAGYTYVGIDNFAIARMIGRYLGKNSSGGKMVYVRSTATDTGCPALRFGGIMGGMSDQGEMHRFALVDERYAPKDVGEAEGMQQMEEMLAANPHIDIVIAHHDAQALGALKAIRAAGRTDVKFLAGFDGELRMLKEIEKGGGINLVTGLNSPTMIADITMQVINDIFQKKPVGSTYYIPVVAISKDNIKDYVKYGF